MACRDVVRLMVTLFLLVVAQVSPALAGSVRLYWDANTEPDLAGYILVYGTAPGVYTQSVSLAPTATTHEVAALADGTYYFAIRAFNAAGLQSGLSNEVTSVVATTGLPAPTVTSFSPASGPTVGGTDVTINGTGFVAGATVRFGAVPATVLQLSGTRIVARTPGQSAGLVALSVVNPDGKGVQLPQAFTYGGLPPSVTRLTPASGPASGGTVVTIEGANFQHGTTVSVSNVQAAVLSVTGSRLVVQMPAHAPGTAAVTVTTPDSQSASLPSAFTYKAGGPALTHVLPESGPQQGGTTVTLIGSGFTAGTTVSFDGLAAPVVAGC